MFKDDHISYDNNLLDLTQQPIGYVNFTRKKNQMNITDLASEVFIIYIDNHMSYEYYLLAKKLFQKIP